MNLKFWSWELKFWTLLVLRRSVSHRWFPSPKQISGFHNQNLCENLNRTSFAWTSWFLVKDHIKANSYRIILFEQFWIPEWRNRPQNWNLREKLGKTGDSWKFDFLVKICVKVKFLEIGQFAQFPSLEQRNGFQNWNVREKLSGTGLFWKFWLFGQSQRSNLVKAFFLRRFRRGHRIRSGTRNRVKLKVVSDVIMTSWSCGARVSAWESSGACERVN